MYYQYSDIFGIENEKPLERFVSNGGYARIFRTIACIGDSLSSGEFESINEDGTHGYHDKYEYSWGQFMARANGTKVYNFSKGGMTAKQYCKTFAQENDYWNTDYKAQAYIIAMGVNDLNLSDKIPFGTFEEDVDLFDWHNNNLDTFIGSYVTIIQRYKEIQPRAKFFLMTLANSDFNENKRNMVENHRRLLYKLSDLFDNCYVLDIYKYGPEYDDDFKKKFYLNGHMNPMGYVFTADMVSSYIDYIVRHNMQDFREIGFIGMD